MTLQEFMDLHSNLVHVESAGVDGIDFELLHNKIEKSRYLKSRQSFIFLVKHYNEIVCGRYDDFRLEIPKDEPVFDEKTLNQIDKLKAKIERLKAINVTPEIDEISKHYIEYTVSEFIEFMKKAAKQPAWIPTVSIKFDNLLGALHDEFGIKV